MAKLNDMYQYKDPFALCEQANGTYSWKLADDSVEGMEDYTLLCSYVFEEKFKGENTISWIDGTFGVFDLLKSDKKLYRIEKIADADGQVRGERLGVFYYNKAPSWIIDQMFVVTEIYNTIFSEDFTVVPILNEKEFDIWLGDEPNRIDSFSDFVLIPMDTKGLSAGINPKYAKYFKEEPEAKLFIVPFQIAELDKEHAVLIPATSLAKWFNACFKLPMEFFKNSVLASNTEANTAACTLLSVTTGAHDTSLVEAEKK